MLVNERLLIIYPSDLFSVEFSSGISTLIITIHETYIKLAQTEVVTGGVL